MQPPLIIESTEFIDASFISNSAQFNLLQLIDRYTGKFMAGLAVVALILQKVKFNEL